MKLNIQLNDIFNNIYNTIKIKKENSYKYKYKNETIHSTLSYKDIIYYKFIPKGTRFACVY